MMMQKGDISGALKEALEFIIDIFGLHLDLLSPYDVALIRLGFLEMSLHIASVSASEKQRARSCDVL
jgi:hypothetical protein